jgi:hypothetical protein
VREGAWSQVYVVLSHERLKVEEAKGCSSSEEKEKVKVKARMPLERTLPSLLSAKGSRLHW